MLFDRAKLKEAFLTEQQSSPASSRGSGGSCRSPIPGSGSSFFRLQLPSGPAQQGASLTSSVLNLTATCMGTGILALPAAFSSAGLAAGQLVCISSAALGIASLYLLDAAASAGRLSQPTFYALCERAQPRSGLLVDASVVINCFGTAAGYLIVAGDSFTEGLPFVALSRRAWICGSVIAIAPLCYLRRIDALRATSLVSITCLLLISLMVLAFAAVTVGGLKPREEPPASACPACEVPS